MSAHQQGFEDAVLGLTGLEKNAARLGFMNAVKRKAGKGVREVATAPKAPPRSALREQRIQKMIQAPAAKPQAKAPPAAPAAAAEKPTLGQRLKKPGMLLGGMGAVGGLGYLGATADRRNQNQYPPMQYNY